MILTKSLYVQGLKCEKLLWIAKHEKELIQVTESQKARMDEGSKVGVIATKCFFGVKTQEGFNECLTQTKELIAKNQTIFEAAFLINDLYARVDILEPYKNGWHIIEVKSSTRPKDEHYPDIAFQKYVLEQAGLRVTKTSLMVIDTSYVLEKELEPKKLFKTIDVAEHLPDDIAQNANRFLSILNGNKPEVAIGYHCNSPHECGMKYECWKHLPENNVFELYNDRKKIKYDAYKEGTTKLENLPLEPLSAQQQIQVTCTKTNNPHIEEKKIKTFLDNLEYPLYFMDFETIAPAIPKYEGTSPYQKIPFQFSVHILDKELKNVSFLAKEGDPRKTFITALKACLGNKGSIIVYHASFEKSVLKPFEGTKELIARIIDLELPFKQFNYYHPKQAGSASIKYIYPLFGTQSYKKLTIQNGDQAMTSYQTNPTDLKVREALEEYCKLDTYAMVEILEGLKKLVN